MVDLYNTYFVNYEKFFGRNIMEFAQNNLQEAWIDSAGGKIHLDIYIKDISAPTIVFSHGMAGYGRLLTSYAYRLYKHVIT